MSFFDEGEEPRTRASPRSRPPRQGAAPRAGQRRDRRGADHQQMLLRRAVALGAAALVLVGLALAISAWRHGAHRGALRDYEQQAAALVQGSESDVAGPFFRLLTGARRRSPFDVETQVNQLRAVAEDQASRARAMSVPGDVVGAQRNLVLALDLRAGALQKVAARVRSALGGDDAAQATAQIAGQMQAFLASDVLVSQRVAPLVDQALHDGGVPGLALPPSRFLPDLGWLDPRVVAARLGAAPAGRPARPVRPGTHGHALASVSVGGVVLAPAAGANRLPASVNPVFTVRFQNQGSNDETGVEVTIRVTGAGPPIVARGTAARTRANQAGAVAVPLGRAPPLGRPVTIDVAIAPVPGERVTTNNRRTFRAVFVR